MIFLSVAPRTRIHSYPRGKGHGYMLEFDGLFSPLIAASGLLVVPINTMTFKYPGAIIILVGSPAN